ncbi:MAG: PAS domain S-box protein [Chloroflexi bacterium]|nr:PAS domain S-box protein [Chloroflexota bacterium]
MTDVTDGKRLKPGVCITAPAGSPPDPRLAALAEAAGFAAHRPGQDSPGEAALRIHDFRGEWDAAAAAEARLKSSGALLVAAGLAGAALAEVAAAGWDDYLESPLEEERALTRLKLLRRRVDRRAVSGATNGPSAALSRLFNASPVAGCWTDESGCYVGVNRAYCELYGYRAEDLVGRHFTVVLRPEDAEEARETYARFLAGGEPQTAHGIVVRGDGEQLHVKWTLWSAGVFDGRRLISTSVEDVTAQYEAERQHRESERRFHTILDTSPDLVSITDLQGRFLFANGAFTTMLGYRPEDLLGRSVASILHPDDAGLVLAAMAGLFTGTRGQNAVFRAVRADGRFVTLEASGRALRGDEWPEPAVIAISRDVTAREEAGEERRRLATILSVEQGASRDAILVVDPDGEAVSWNRRFLDLWGMDEATVRAGRAARSEAISRLLKDPEGFVGRVQELYRTPLATYGSERILRDGRVIDTYSAPLLGDNGENYGRVWYYRDITERRHAEETLRESEERFRSLANATPLYVWVADPEGGCLFVNQSWLALTGSTLERELGEGWKAHVHPADLGPLDRVYTLATQARAPYTTEYRVRRRDGDYRWVLDTGVPRFEPNGEFAGYIGSSVDITATRQAAEENRRLTAILKVSQEASPDGILVVGLAGEVLSHNRRYRDMWGLSEEVVVGSRAERRAAPYRLVENAEEMRALVADALARPNASLSGEISLRDGRVFDAHSAPLVGDDGEPFGRLWQFRDISVRKAAEEAIRASEEKYRSLFERVPEGLYQSTIEGRLLTANPALVRLFGFESEEELLAVNDIGQLYADPDDRQDMLQRLRDGGGSFNGELRLRRRDGSEIIVLENSRWVQGENGQVLYLEGTLTDITARKQAEDALSKSEERFSRAFHASPAATRIVNFADGRFIDANQAFLEIIGYDLDEVVGKTAHELGLWSDTTVRDRVAAELSHQGSVTGLERQLRHKDGETRDVVDFYELIEIAGQPCILATSVDITGRKRAEEALRKSEERFSRAFHASPAATSILTYRDGIFVDVNPAYEELSGYGREEVLGKKEQDLDIWQRRDEIRALARTLRQTGTIASNERQLRRKDGELREVLESYALIEVDGELCVLTASLDITERKRAETERLDLERKLLETQKLESLGVLAGGIAHDFNNLLVAIMGNANLAMMELPPSSPVRPYLEEVETASERAADLARQMLAYSGKGRFVVERVELSAMVQEMGNLLHVSLPKKVALYYNLTAGLPPVEADPTQLRQVIMNLVINGAESIGDNPGRVTVSTGVLHANRAALASAYLSPDLDEGDYVYVDVSDTGSGMDAATKARIFEPFFTTKFTGRGLGLSAVLGIVRRHGGAIKVESEPGEGTTFRLLLPAAPPEAPGPSKEAPATGAAGRTGCVLIADDEPTVRTVTARMLERMGFRVIAAADGEEALELFAANRDEVTLVLLDMTMPRLDGRETVRALHELAPGLPVVLMSGYSEQEAAASFAEGGLAGFIQKPFTFDDVKALVAKVLAG